jgi:hypothetical protein
MSEGSGGKKVYALTPTDMRTSLPFCTPANRELQSDTSLFKARYLFWNAQWETWVQRCKEPEVYILELSLPFPCPPEYLKLRRRW